MLTARLCAAAAAALLSVSVHPALGTPPTRAPYRPVEFVPASGIETMHNGLRIGGVNQLSVADAQQAANMQGNTYNYAVGIIVPVVVIAVLVPIWCCSLCCVGKLCCRVDHSKKNRALAVFTAGAATSIAGWILGIVASGIATTGLNSFVSGINGVKGLGQTVITSSLGTKVYTAEMDQLSVDMDSQCSNNPEVPFPGARIRAQVAAVDALVGATNSPNGLVGQIQEFVDLVDLYMTNVTSYIDWQSYVIITSMTVVACVVGLFLLTTVLRVMDNTPEKCQPIARVTGKSTAVVVFCCGILVMTLVWVLVCVIHFFAALGSDLCVPSPNYQINRLFYEVTEYGFGGFPVGNVGRRRLLGEELESELRGDMFELSADGRDLQEATAAPTLAGNACLDPEFRASMFGMLCYYQDCQGSNEWLENLADPIKAQSQQTSDELDQFKADVAAAGGTLTPECNSSISSFQNKTRGVNGLVDDSMGVVLCYRVNPIYAAFMYDGLCNGLINGLYFLYVAMIIGCVFLMLAMSVYRAFDFGSYQDGKQPEEWVEEGQVYAGGAPPGGSGGPIVATAVKVDAA